MSTLSSIVLDGLLKADGTIQLDKPPALPPGRVRVTLRVFAEAQREGTRLPDLPWLDESISAPFDLPHVGHACRVQPRQVAERLPEPLEGIEGQE